MVVCNLNQDLLHSLVPVNNETLLTTAATLVSLKFY